MYKLQMQLGAIDKDDPHFLEQKQVCSMSFRLGYRGTLG